MGGGKLYTIEIDKDILEEILNLERPFFNPWKPETLKLIYEHFDKVKNKKKFARLLHKSYKRIKKVYELLKEAERVKNAPLSDYDLITFSQNASNTV